MPASWGGKRASFTKVGQAREGAAAALGQGKEQCWQGGVQQAQDSGMAKEAADCVRKRKASEKTEKMQQG